MQMIKNSRVEQRHFEDEMRVASAFLVGDRSD